MDINELRDYWETEIHNTKVRFARRIIWAGALMFIFGLIIGYLWK